MWSASCGRNRRGTGSRTQPSYFNSVQYRINLENKIPAPIEKTAEIVRFLKDTTYSPTVLDTYFSCPLQFYYSTVLRIDKKEEVTGGIERVDIGKLVHAALSVYFGKRKGHILKEAEIDLKEMDSIVEDLFAKDYGRDLTGTPYLLRKQIKTHLRDFLKFYTVPLVREQTVTILNVEQSVKVDRESFHLKGRLDHVEKRGHEDLHPRLQNGRQPHPLENQPGYVRPGEKRDLESWRSGASNSPFTCCFIPKPPEKK